MTTPSTTKPSRHAILIVEDEPLLRVDTMDMVEDEGFRAFEAPNAQEALIILKLHPEISGICTDIDMPGAMDGLGLAQEVSRLWPAIAIVVVSGLHKPAIAGLPEVGRFVAKPYGKAIIIGALRESMRHTLLLH